MTSFEKGKLVLAESVAARVCVVIARNVSIANATTDFTRWRVGDHMLSYGARYSAFAAVVIRSMFSKFIDPLKYCHGKFKADGTPARLIM